MKQKFSLKLDRQLSHNNMIFIPVSQDIRILGVSAVSCLGEEIVILNSSIDVNSKTSIRYPTICSSKILIEVEGQYVNELKIDDIISIDVSLAKYVQSGTYVSEEQSMSFHEILTVVYEIDNIKDAFVKAKLNIKTIDKYDNIIYGEDIAISLNDDLKMINISENNNIKLDVIPRNTEVIVGESSTKEWTIDGDVISIDVPSGEEAYAIYTPFYFNSGQFQKVTENIQMNSNGEVKLRKANCEKILYTIGIEIFNLDITSINHTPILKSLAVVAAD